MKAIALLLALTLPAMAQPPAAQMIAPGSNMPADFYPHHSCTKPQKITKDSTARTSGGSAQPWAPMVNKEAEQFNQAATLFNICIKTYVDNARLDTQQVLRRECSCGAGSQYPVHASRWRQYANRFLSAKSLHPAGAAGKPRHSTGPGDGA